MSNTSLERDIEQAIKREKGWHFNKEIPISIIIVLCVQLATAVWYMSKLDFRVETLEEVNVKRDAVRTAEQHDINSALNDVEIRVQQESIYVREQLSDVKSDVRVFKEVMGRVESKLDRIIEPGGSNGR